MTKPIGDVVQTTDDWSQAGYDSVALRQGGAVKADKVVGTQDLVLKGNGVAADPVPLRLKADFPAKIEIATAGNFDLDATAEGGTAPYTYAWYHNNHKGNLTAATIDFSSTTINSLGYWYAIVTDKTGATVKSNTVFIY